MSQNLDTSTPMLAHDYLASVLATVVDFSFGVVGTPVTPFVESLQRHGVKFVAFRNEQSAAYAASIAGFVSHRPALCVTVSGPGAIHALSGIANASGNCWPMILVSSAPRTSQVHSGAFQETAQFELVAPLCKYAAELRQVERFDEHVRRAVRASVNGRPGPVYLQVPTEMLFASVPSAVVGATNSLLQASESARLSLVRPLACAATSNDIRHAIGALRAAQRPLIVIGKACAYSRAESHLSRLLARTGFPVLAMPMAKGTVSDSHTQSCGPARSLVLGQADVILVLGARLNWMLDYGREPRFAVGVRFVRVDVCAEDMHVDVPLGNVHVDGSPHHVSLVGDLPTVIDQLVDAWPADSPPLELSSDWWTRIHAKVETNRKLLQPKLVAATVPLSYHYVLHRIAERLHPEWTFVNEGANTMDFGRLVVPHSLPRKRLDAGTLATMGLGTGYAIAAAAIDPSKLVVSVQGDSAFGFSAMDFETACRYALPIVFIVINNSGIYQGVDVLPGDTPTSRMLTIHPTSLTPDTRYDILAQACGATGYNVHTADELNAALAATLGAAHDAHTSGTSRPPLTSPVIINVNIDQSGPVPRVVKATSH